MSISGSNKLFRIEIKSKMNSRNMISIHNRKVPKVWKVSVVNNKVIDLHIVKPVKIIKIKK